MTICHSLGLGKLKPIHNSGGNGMLNSNHWGTGQGETAGNLGEWVSQVTRGIPTSGGILFDMSCEY